MRQALGEYDDRDDGYGLVGEERTDELPARDRRLPMLLLTVFAMALFAGGLYFAYVAGTHHPAGTTRGEGVPLIRADEHPTKVRPDQPGGMTIPDQNVSLYNEKAGGPPVEKLLPAPEQPMPRPTPPPPAPDSTAAASSPAPAPGAPAAGAPSAPASQPTAGATARQPAQAAGRAGPFQLRLGSLRTPEAAREEWAKLKRENPDLLGKLTAVAVRTDLGDKGIYYRIQAGSFGEAAAAERLCSELKRRNLGCILAR
jgi:cell division septation protein DedD